MRYGGEAINYNDKMNREEFDKYLKSEEFKGKVYEKFREIVYSGEISYRWTSGCSVTGCTTDSCLKPGVECGKFIKLD